eukprot:20778_1
MSAITSDNWLSDVFDHVASTEQWNKCCSRIELICKEFVETHQSNEPYLHCLLHLLGIQFTKTYFPNVSISYYYLKEPFVNSQQLKQLQNNLLIQLKSFIIEKLNENHQFIDKYKHNLSEFTKCLLPSNNNNNNNNLIKAKSKQDINDAISMILSVY